LSIVFVLTGAGILFVMLIAILVLLPLLNHSLRKFPSTQSDIISPLSS
jgi:hypothetical protein